MGRGLGVGHKGRETGAEHAKSIVVKTSEHQCGANRNVRTHEQDEGGLFQ